VRLQSKIFEKRFGKSKTFVNDYLIKQIGLVGINVNEVEDVFSHSLFESSMGVSVGAMRFKKKVAKKEKKLKEFQSIVFSFDL